MLHTWDGLHARTFDTTLEVHPATDGTNAENASKSIGYALVIYEEDGDLAVAAPIYVEP